MPPTTASPALSESTPLAVAKFAAKPFLKALENGLGITTVHDVLHHFPRRYEDRTYFRPIARIKPGETVTLCGIVGLVQNTPTRSRMVVTRVAVSDGSGVAFLVFFNQWFLKKQFEKLVGQQIIAYGKTSPTPSGRGLELTEVEWEISGDGDPLSANRIVPIYPLGEGIRQGRLRKLVYAVSTAFGDGFHDPLPNAMRRRQSLAATSEAMRDIHFPDTFDALEQARRRLTFDEFLGVQLALIQRKRADEKQTGIAFHEARAAIEELKAALPFQMTPAQQRVIDEISAGMLSSRPMNRLIQGDVGSGKTAVAIAALLIAVRSGYQAALMAPTEILAEQHAAGIKRLLQKLDVPVALVTGSLGAKEKADMLQCIADGVYPVVVGTHALIQDAVSFKKLGLAIIDEQHRFGVLQRAALRQKAARRAAPDVLVMTATPIPRTLTLTLYGDLDISVIDQLPPGRKAIRTHWKRSADRPLVYETLRSLLERKRQAYVICPLVEESEKRQARAATELAEHLSIDVFPEYRIGLLHGQMKAAAKDDVMSRFRDGEIDLLVSTTVIEVGVDVPNASIIVIEDADRFGLAQLHQLRGRVGRGATQSYCLLIADPKTQDGEARMSIMARTGDGFEIAEEDLRLRGPGDFYGTRQSGIDLLPFIDFVRDTPILDNARTEAIRTLNDDPNLRKPLNKGLRDLAEARSRLLAQTSATN